MLVCMLPRHVENLIVFPCEAAAATASGRLAQSAAQNMPALRLTLPELKLEVGAATVDRLDDDFTALTVSRKAAFA
jgi:hypothetical protein